MPQETCTIQPRIQALPQQVIDRIAAGEVVQRPASVVKELLENSLDAQAFNIDVQCIAGGMRFISVTDDGHGIHPQDLPLAARRFATSKLRQLDDLRQIQTFGFRGEALASASMVGRLEIVSKRRRTFDGAAAAVAASTCAYKMTYQDGEPRGRSVPSAGKEGTCVKLQDLFYNIPNRKRAFEGARKEAEEYQRILNVVQKYAVDRAREGVGFVCRKKGGNTDLNTSSMSCIKNLQQRRRRRRRQEDDHEKKGEDDHEKEDDNEEYCKLQEQCTRNVIGHVYGSDTCRELLVFQCEEGNVYDVSMAALKAAATTATDQTGAECKDDEHKLLQNHNMVLMGEKQTELKLLQEGKMLQDCFNHGNDGYDYGAMIAKQSKFSRDDDDDNDQYSFAFKAYGLVTKGSYCVPKASSAFLLFINKRLVESTSLKRALESVYLDMLPKGAKPFIYMSLELPGPHLDVNVHPTKQEVAFLHEDRLCDALVTALRSLLRSSTTSRTFYTQTLLADSCTIMKKVEKEKEDKQAEPTLFANNGNDNEHEDNPNQQRNKNGNASRVVGTNENDSTEKLEKNDELEQQQDVTPAKKRKVYYDPKNLVRTTLATEQGALVPFLVPTQTKVQSQNEQIVQKKQTIINSSTDASHFESAKDNTISTLVHAPDCEFSSESQKLDLSIPGAFAFLCRCQVKQAANVSALQKSNNASTPVVRPKKIVPTECSYISIEALRRDIQDRAHDELTTKLRESTFVGCINRYRCLLQSGIELLMVNHYELGKELFYQLSVLRFGGFEMAKLGAEGVEVKCLIQQALQFEDTSKSFLSLNESQSSEDINLSQDDVNSELAKQAAKCLFDNSEMLEEYFSIKFVLKNEAQLESDEGILLLTGLPIILDGHSPSQQALPLFLLRLATEVDWSEEQPCFEGICTELGRYYAEVPVWKQAINQIGNKLELIDDEEKKYVQHTLFPALRYLLVPPKEFANDGSFLKLALLSKLYKVFERC
jgi:DNA mismatch repair protein MutL